MADDVLKPGVRKSTKGQTNGFKDLPCSLTDGTTSTRLGDLASSGTLPNTSCTRGTSLRYKDEER